MNIPNIKKVELHLHLDGSISLDLVKKLSNLPIEEIKKQMIAKEKCNDLKDYLTHFDLPISIMQTKENLKLVALDLIKQLKKDNVIYAEVRFAPIFHTKQGLSIEEVVTTINEVFNQEQDIKLNLILCMMRGTKPKDNAEIIYLAKKYLNKGVCAIDLAGDEINYPLELYKDLFKKADELNIPFTIHAGETSNSKEIKKAIQFNAKRIGHGIKAIDDDEVLNIIKEKQILLEICPTSNIQTNAVDKIQNHPVYKLYQQGILLNINTDNRTVSNTTLNKEYKLLQDTFKFTTADFIKMNKWAIEKSFLNDQEKEKISKLLTKF